MSSGSRTGHVGAILHKTYSIAEATAAFDPNGAVEFVCDRQFVVLPDAILCMFAAGDPASAAHLDSPSDVTWRPQQIDYEPLADIPWLPRKVRDVFGPDRRPVKQHHMFLRLPGDGKFFYAGRAHLGSYSVPPPGSASADRSASFSLYEKLPRPEWQRLGGYPGWLIELNHRTTRVENGDLDALRNLLAELPCREFSHLSLSVTRRTRSIFTPTRGAAGSCIPATWQTPASIPEIFPVADAIRKPKHFDAPAASN
ncbi:MAG TPA: hypothetical protein VL048_07625 [Xanthobacteraceae bacterium]|nr:hypothetical protein [Xanthobacteraceae bacterium]